MPCTNCMAKYSLVRKEHGCSSCGYGFCAKCLNKKFVLKNLSDKPMPVCGGCFHKLTEQEAGRPVEQKVRAEMDDEKWGVTVDAPPSFRDLFPKNKANPGKHRAKEPLPLHDEDKELAERLAKISGRDPEQVLHPMKMVVNPDPSKLTLNNKPKETAQDLIKKIADSPDVKNRNLQKEVHEVEMRSLEQRLAALRNVPVEQIQKPRTIIPACQSYSDLDSEEELPDEAKELIAMAEKKMRKAEPELFAYENEAMDSDLEDSKR